MPQPLCGSFKFESKRNYALVNQKGASVKSMLPMIFRVLLLSKKQMNSFRKRGWDYSRKASYLVTLVTKDWSPFFGSVGSDLIELNSLGKLAGHFWERIPGFHPYIELGSFIVMPEHIHGILHFRDTTDGNSGTFGPQRKNLGSIIRGYKSAVTSQSRNLNPKFKWQRGYDDQILFHINDIYRAEKYILKNPSRRIKKSGA